MRIIAVCGLVTVAGAVVWGCTSEADSGGPIRAGSGSSSGESSSGDGTSGAAGHADGGASGSTFSCSSGSFLFCDDFESYAAGPAKSTKWDGVTGGDSDTLTIDTTHVRSGKALHVHVSENEYAYAKVTFAPPNNSFYGRAYVWATAFPTAPDYAHFTLVEAAGDPDSAGVVRPIGGQYDPEGKSSDWGVGSDQGPTGDWTSWKTTAPAAAGTWLCLEWQMDAAGDAINVWIDGAAKPELGVTKTSHGGNNVDFVFPTWKSVWFGWWLYQDSPAPGQYDLWYDDVVLSSARVGCE